MCVYLIIDEMERLSPPAEKRAKTGTHTSPLGKSSAQTSGNCSANRSMPSSSHRSLTTDPSNVQEKFLQAQPYSFFLTRVVGIKDKYNAAYVMDIKGKSFDTYQSVFHMTLSLHLLCTFQCIFVVIE